MSDASLLLCFFLVGNCSAAEPTSSSEESTARKFTTGLVVGHRDRKFVVLGAAPGSLAERSALEEGDIILQINDLPTADLGFRQAIAAIRGTDATPVKMLVGRQGKHFGTILQRESLEDFLARNRLREEGDTWVPATEAPAPLLGGPAPELHGTSAETGKPVSLRDFKGRYVLITFWASWCGPCKGEVPHLRDLLAHYGSTRPEAPRSQGSTPVQLAIIGISLDDDQAAFQRFVAKHEFATVHLFDGGWFGLNSKAYHAYQRGVPWTVLVAPDGTIKSWGHRVEKLRAAIQALESPDQPKLPLEQ